MSVTAEREASCDEPIPELLDSYTGYLAARMLLRVPDQPFLQDVARLSVGDAVGEPEALSEAVARLSRTLDRDMGHPACEGHPLVVLSQAYALSPFELDLLMLAALPELDERFGDLFFELTKRSRRRLTVGMALAFLVSEEMRRSEVRAGLAGSALWEGVLLRGPEPRPPLFERILETNATLSAGIEGRLPQRLDGGARVSLQDPQTNPGLQLALTLRAPIREAAADLVRWVEAVGHGVVHIPTGDRDLGDLFAGAVAHTLGMPLVLVAHDGGEPSAALHEGTLCALIHSAALAFELSPEQSSFRLPDRWTPPGIALLLTAPRCTLSVSQEIPVRRLAPPVPRPAEQAAIWSHFLDEAGGTAVVDVLANQTRLSVEQIARVVQLGNDYARLEGHKAPGHPEIVRALQEVVPEPSSPLARTRRPSVPWSRLVLDRRTKTRIEELVRRVQHRVTVQDRWGMAGIEGRGEGLVMLLHGESGTGKTLGAEAIATQISLPMLSVDLSCVVSKYIGETEKHLDELFALGEGFRAMLFFDEADALFGKRTGVSDAHDRYANIEVNFLLQRLEVFEGIAVLATNILKNLDDAFMRRIQFSIHLPRPNPSQQIAIWRQHLPAERLAPEVQLEALATRFDLVGGEIRNAALTAAYAAAARDGVITQTLLEDGVKQELVKKGRPVPAS